MSSNSLEREEEGGEQSNSWDLKINSSNILEGLNGSSNNHSSSNNSNSLNHNNSHRNRHDESSVSKISECELD